MSALREVFASFRIEANDDKLKKLDVGVSGLAGKLRGLGAALAGGALVAGLRHFVNQTVEAGSEINDSAARLGFATDELQTWRYAAKLAGVGAEGLEGAFQKLNLAADNASQGSKPQVAAFRALGVAFKDVSGRIRPTAELLPEIADGLAKIDDPAKQSGLAVDLLGRSGTRLLPLLKEGSGGLARYRKELEELGGVMSAEMIEQADKYGDNVDRMNFALDGLRNTIVVHVLPALSSVVLTVAKGVAAVSKLVEKTNILKIAGAALAGTIATWVVRLAVANSGVLLMAGGIAIAILAIEDFYTLMTGGKSVIGDFADAHKPLGTDAAGWVDNLTRSYQFLVDVLSTLGALTVDLGSLVLGDNPQALKSLREGIAARDAANTPENKAQQKNEAQKEAVRSGNVEAFQAAGGSFEVFKERRLKYINSGYAAPQDGGGRIPITEKDRATFGGLIKPVDWRTGAALDVQAKGGGKTVQMAPVNITVNATGTSREQAQEIAKIAGAEIDKRTRAAHAALREQG